MEPKPSRLAIALPFLLSLVFGGFVALPQVRADAVLLETFLITAGLLFGWAVALWLAEEHAIPGPVHVLR